MADQNQLLIEIVLDDGSVQKGFAKIRSEGEKASKGMGDQFNNALGALSNPVKALAGLSLLGISAAAVGAALNKSLDAVLNGERLRAIEAQFMNLADSAGIAGGSLKEGLESASRGLVDVDDLLQRANSAIVNLGRSAEQLPDILSVAVNATRTLGGSVEDRFNAIVQAVETGNARILKSRGIIIDSDAAFKAYGETLGLLANELNLAQRQQAILNEVLTVGKQRFNESNASVQPLAEGFTKAKIAFGDLSEAIEKRASKNNTILGRLFEIAANAARAITENINPKSIDTAAQATEKIAQLQREIDDNNKNLSRNEDVRRQFAAQLNAELAKTIVLREELNRKESAALGEKIINEAKAKQLSDDQLANIRSRANEAIKFQTAASQEVLKLQAEDLMKQQENETNRLALQQNIGEQIKNLRITQEIEAQEAEKKLRELGVSDEEEILRTKVFLYQKHDQEIKTLEEQAQARQLERNKSLIASMNSILAGGLTNIFKDVGERLQKGQGLFDNFGQGIAGIAGDMMITLGQAIIAQGIAASKFVQGLISLSPYALGAAVALGAGLVIFGSALKASVGLGSGSDAPDSSGASFADTGIGTAPGASTEIAGPEERDPTTEIVVNFQGDILGDESAGARIVDLINSAFDSQGVKVRRGVMA